MLILNTIGTVASRFREKTDPFVMRKEESRIILGKEYLEGLFRLDESPYIQVIFGLHLSKGYTLKGPVYTGEIKGVFASRSPHRPAPLGVTVVKLLHIAGNILTVTGLDAIDGSPVYDIKPHASIFDEADSAFAQAGYEKEWLYTAPRSEMIRLVKTNALAECLLKAGTLHGHFCPGLSTGVYAAVTGLQKLSGFTQDGMEHLLAITETNSCFADGIQAVTGCTFGNNSLIYHDIGKTAVTLIIRGKEKGIRILVKPEFHTLLSERYPDFSVLFQKVVRERKGNEEELAAFKAKGREAAFGLLAMSFDSLFNISEVKSAIPAYAPVFDSLVCPDCGEQFMASRAVQTDRAILCRQCSKTAYPCLTGAGIAVSQDNG